MHWNTYLPIYPHYRIHGFPAYISIVPTLCFYWLVVTIHLWNHSDTSQQLFQIFQLALVKMFMYMIINYFWVDTTSSILARIVQYEIDSRIKKGYKQKGCTCILHIFSMMHTQGTIVQSLVPFLDRILKIYAA